MTFSRILQCLIFFITSFYSFSPLFTKSPTIVTAAFASEINLEAGKKSTRESKSDTKASLDTRGNSSKAKKQESKTGKQKFNKTKVPVVNITATSENSIVDQIKAHLKTLDSKQSLNSQQKLRPLLPQKARMVLTRKQNSLLVEINSEKEIAGTAVFSQGKTWYVVLGGVTEVDVAPYEKEMIPNFNATTVIKSDTGESIVKIDLSRQQAVTFTQKPKGVELHFQHRYQAANCDDLIELPPTPQAPYRIQTRFADRVIEFDDPVTQNSFWVLTAEKPFREINEHSYPEFTLLNSEIGVAIHKVSENLEIDYSRRKVSIVLETGLSVSPRFPIETGVKPHSIFGDFNAASAPTRVKALTHLASRAGSEVIQKNIELIWQYLGLGKVPEALALANLLRESYPDILLIPVFRALDGVIQLLVNRAGKAAELLEVLSYDAEPKFWYRLAVTSKNEFIDTDSLHNLMRYRDHFQLLPPLLQTRFLGLILQAAVLHKDSGVLDVFTQENFYPDDIFVQQLYQLATALTMLQNGQKGKAIKYLKILAQNPVSQRVAVLAAFELVKEEGKDKTIGLDEELATLNRLRFSWRGDFLEYYIAKYYVQRLEEEKHYAKTLPVLRSLIKYFPDQAHRDKLPEMMQKSLLNFFQQKPVPSLMESLSIFQEYGDLAPDNEQGDQIILKATGELVQLDLYQDALDILKKYMDKKFQDNKVKDNKTNTDRRQIFLYKIAAIELLAKDPQECLKVLEGITTPPAEIIDEVALLKAEALKQSGQIDAAIASLGKTVRQIEKKAEFYFAKEKWSDAASCYQKAFEMADEKDKEEQAKCIYNLTLVYATGNMKDKLEEVKESYGELMSETKYKDMFDFLTANIAFHGALTSTEFNKIDNFTDNLKKILS